MGLRMMTYQEANSILYSKLNPPERCIRRGVGESNDAVFDTFIANNTPQGADPDVLFPSTRLMPVEALENEPQPSSCFLPFDDMTMVLLGYNGDPGGRWDSSSETGYDGYVNDVVAAGWQYTIDRIIIYGYDSDDPETRNDHIYKNTNQQSYLEADWLMINMTPEASGGEMVFSENASGGGNHFALLSGRTLCWTGIHYNFKLRLAGYGYREATIVFKAVKNTSVWNDAETLANNNNANVAEDVCSTFHVTVRQRAGVGGDNGEGKKLAKFSNISSNGSITLTCNSAANTGLDLAVFGTGSSGNNGYWSSLSGLEAVNIDTTPYDYTNVVTFSGSDNTKTITIAPHALDNMYISGISGDYESFYIAATWAKCAASQNNRPPQPVTAPTFNITVSGTDSFVSNHTAAGESENEWEDNNGTFGVNIQSASAINFKNANLNQISERGSCVLQVRYRIGGDGNTHDLTIKRIDVPFKYSNTYIKPIFYPTNFVWPSENAVTSRNYNGKEAELNSTATVTLYSKVNGLNADMTLTMCDINGDALTSDNSTYPITINGSTSTLTKDDSINIKGNVTSFTIAFTNVIKSGSTDTKRFKIQQKKSSVRASVSDNMSPEYAIIAFTFNE